MAFKDKGRQRERQNRLDFINKLPLPITENDRIATQLRIMDTVDVEKQQKARVLYVYKPKVGYIYVIHCVGFPYYKIGQTTIPKGRLDGLQIGVPFELTLEYAIKVVDMNEVERKVQQQYKDKCIRGEWFMLTDGELEAVKGSITSLREYVFGCAHSPSLASQEAV